jgi:steroid delta-isomerase-like uncharacterized protein
MSGQTAQSNARERLISSLVDAWNAHDVEALLDLLSPDYEQSDVCQATPQRGLDQTREVVEAYLAAFPDLRFTTEEMIVQENHVAVRWSANGTHRGTVLHIPPTHKVVRVCGVSMFTLEDNKISRGRHIWDVAAMLREMGLLPEL